MTERNQLAPSLLNSSLSRQNYAQITPVNPRVRIAEKDGEMCLERGNKPTRHSESCKGKPEAYPKHKKQALPLQREQAKGNVASCFLQQEEPWQNDLENHGLMAENYTDHKRKKQLPSLKSYLPVADRQTLHTPLQRTGGGGEGEALIIRTGSCPFTLLQASFFSSRTKQRHEADNTHCQQPI